MWFLNVRNAQGLQIRSVVGVDCTPRVYPAAQVVAFTHVVFCPGSALKVPVTHVVHTRFEVVVISIVRLCPAGQVDPVLQLTCPCRFWYWFLAGLQAVQEGAFSESENVPAGHDEHSQSLDAVAARMTYCPKPQGLAFRHSVCPGWSWYVPGPHVTQMRSDVAVGNPV